MIRRLMHGLQRFKNGAQFAASNRIDMRSLGREIATRDAAEWAMFLGILPDPDPVLRRRGDGVEILEELTADPHLESVIGTRKSGTKAREWRIEPGSVNGEKPDQAADELALRFAADLERVDIANLIGEILNAPLYGNVPIEIIWRPGDGWAHIHDLRALPSRWFGFDEEGAPRFLSKENPFDGEALPFGKFVFARNEPTYDNPYGKRLLSRCFWPVTFKKAGLQFWVTFAEKYGMPFLLGKYGQGVDKPGQERMLSQLASMVQDAVALVPDNSKVELLTAQGNTGGMVFEKLYNAMDAAMSKVIMGQTLTADVGSSGSYAAGKVHENVLRLYQAADQKLVTSVFEDIAWHYGQINAPGVPSPLFTWFEEEDIQESRAARDNVLSQTMGRSGYRFTAGYFQKQYSLADDDIERIPEQTDQAPEFAEGGGRPSATWQAAVDDLAASAVEDASGAFKGNEDLLLKAVQESSSYEAAVEKLLALYPALETAEFEEMLGRAIAAADFYGRWTVQEETDDGR